MYVTQKHLSDAFLDQSLKIKAVSNYNKELCLELKIMDLRYKQASIKLTFKQKQTKCTVQIRMFVML